MRGRACSSFFDHLDERSLWESEIYFLSSVQGVSGRYPSGQRGQTVNLLPSASKVRILACPPHQACMT